MIGPLPETPRGNKYIVILTDYFSKWAEAAPLPSKHAEGVARFIYSVSIHMARHSADGLLSFPPGVNQTFSILHAVSAAHEAPN